ncbi:hypothetical protein O3G_MSEX013805 [Manduca sexta]|uniref:Single domain-containing protein n=1 Tax=Manduca sexta TaxID=7130 RepID=A0A922CZW3_MANSE|nr:hypothetical protein O3G_MSEX013805 [Manduca sexta]
MMLRSVVVLCIFIPIVYSSISLGPHQPKPEKFKEAEGCYVEELDEVLPFGQGRSSKKECLEYFCYEKSLSYASCGFVEALPPCTVLEEKGKPYPDCCQRVVCPSDNITNADGLLIQ